MRLYVTGGSGYLGTYLVAAARALGWQVRASHYSHPIDDTQDTVDLRQRGALTQAINAFRPDAVIHTAYRQNDPDLHAVTVLGAVEAAAASAVINARHIHLSSDMVFAGTADEYDEIDMPDPIVPYGVAKAVADSVASGVIPADQAEELVIVCGVFIHPAAEDDAKIQKYNYEATVEAIKNAMAGLPSVKTVVDSRESATHPFAAAK